MKTKLVRTPREGMVHVSYCRYAKTGRPWNWADDKTPMQILLDALPLNIKYCMYCNPLGSDSIQNHRAHKPMEALQ